MVRVGLALPVVGNTELPATYRLAVPCTRQSASTTPSRGLAAIRVVPIWCQLICIVGASGSHVVADQVAGARPTAARLLQCGMQADTALAQPSHLVGDPAREHRHAALVVLGQLPIELHSWHAQGVTLASQGDAAVRIGLGVQS